MWGEFTHKGPVTRKIITVDDVIMPHSRWAVFFKNNVIQGKTLQTQLIGSMCTVDADGLVF